MLSSWTAEEVAALAPNPRALQAARNLVGRAKWSALGASGALIWGTFRRAIGQTIEVQIDLNGPVFLCSCRSQFAPCYHSLALLLLYAEQRHLFAATALPTHVIAWLSRRSDGDGGPLLAADLAWVSHDPAYVARRTAAIGDGLAALRRWLRDLVRAGTAEAPQRPYEFWGAMARQLDGAECPAAARQVQEAARTVMLQAEGWPDALLAELSRLYLLTTAWPQIAGLALQDQVDLRAAVGWAPAPPLLAAQTALHDDWLVVSHQPAAGSPAETDELILWGTTTGRLVRLTAHPAPAQAGQCLRGAALLYPSATPLRGRWQAPPQPLDRPQPLPVGAPTIAAAVAFFADRCARQPWLRRWPLLLADVVLDRAGDAWRVADVHGETLPLAPAFAAAWELLAVSGGRPLMLLGEWDGQGLWPLSAHTAGSWLDLPQPRQWRRDERLV